MTGEAVSKEALSAEQRAEASFGKQGAGRGRRTGDRRATGRHPDPAEEAKLARLARVSGVLALYFDLDARLRGLPEKSLTDAAGALRQLASLTAEQERAVRELLAVKAAGARGLAGGELRWRRPPSASGSRRLARFVPSRSWPLFWEAAAFLLGLAMAFFLT